MPGPVADALGLEVDAAIACQSWWGVQGLVHVGARANADSRLPTAAPDPGFDRSVC
jgi:hypothetical protein